MPLHRSTELVKYMKEENMSFAYIPSFTPELVQIERYFGMLKRIVIKNNTGNQKLQRMYWRVLCLKYHLKT